MVLDRGIDLSDECSVLRALLVISFPGVHEDVVDQEEACQALAQGAQADSGQERFEQALGMCGNERTRRSQTQ